MMIYGGYVTIPQWTVTFLRHSVTMAQRTTPTILPIHMRKRL